MPSALASCGDLFESEGMCELLVSVDMVSTATEVGSVGDAFPEYIADEGVTDLRSRLRFRSSRRIGTMLDSSSSLLSTVSLRESSLI